MGVPTFYRWLVTRYPKIVKNVYEHMDSDEFVRRKRVNEEGDTYLVPDLVDYVNNTDKEHYSDNINGYFDNFYLDMNGIIHCCSHPPGGKTPSSNGEIFVNIFQYIERLFDIIEPRRLLFMAIDGVAPKAKMNQQRSRRFKTILDSEIEKKIYHQLKAQFESENRYVPEEPVFWDSNVITPGTQFMYELSVALKYFIEYKITHDEKWKKIVVIFSDANVCGEGEHKIYNFIKSQRFQKNYDPNIRHIIHGMDADLIMLSLASHEPFFYILREIIDMDQKTDEEKKHKNFIGTLNNQENVKYCVKMKIKNKKHNKYTSRQFANIISDPQRPFTETWKELQILDLSILREYLAKDFEFKGQFSVERCIDDFIFICFLCGNDFLPHLPSISIVSGSIDQLIVLYQNVLPVLGDYLTCEGILNMKPISKFISFIAEVERETFISQRDYKKRREQRELQLKENMKKVKYESKEFSGDKGDTGEEKKERETNENHILANTVKLGNVNIQHAKNVSDGNKEQRGNQNKENDLKLNNEEGNFSISKKKMYEDKILSMEPMRNVKYKDKKGEHMINFLVYPQKGTDNDPTDNAVEETTLHDNNTYLEGREESEEENSMDASRKELAVSQKEIDLLEFDALLKEAVKKAKENENPKEDVELGGDEDFRIIRLKYYKSKFHLDESDDIESFIQRVVSKYLEGLAWVLLYYFQSCPMWHWYYPYYYSPLSSDLVVDNVNVNFEKDEPLLPFEQLLSVLPSSSCHCLPKAYRRLMIRNDSPIIDFYPTTFKEEENGKKFKYQWIVLLPFVDKERLIKHATPLHATLTEDEKKRNRRGYNKIYVDKTHVLSKQMRTALRKFLLELKEQENQKALKHGGSTEEEESEALEQADSLKKQTSICLEDIYQKVDTKVPIEYIKEVNIFGYFYFKHDDEDVDLLKRILNFTSNFSSTCNSAFYLEPEFVKHTSSLLKNHVKPKQVLSLVDINNEDRKLRFNATAAKRMILNSLSNNHSHIYSHVHINTYKNPSANYNFYNANYSGGQHSGGQHSGYSFNSNTTLYKYGTTYEQPFITGGIRHVTNYNRPIAHQNYPHQHRQQRDDQHNRYTSPHIYSGNDYNRHTSRQNYSGNDYNPYVNSRMQNSRHMNNYANGGHMHKKFDSESYRSNFLRYAHKDHNTFKTNRVHSTNTYNHAGGTGWGIGERGERGERRDRGMYNEYGYREPVNRYHYDGGRPNFPPNVGGNKEIGAPPNNLHKSNTSYGNFKNRHQDNRRYM